MGEQNQLAMNRQQSGSRAGEREDSRPKDWSAFFAPDAPVASEEFMVGVEDLPVQERAFFAAPQKLPTRGKSRRRRLKSE
jgi:hypothetical protein